MLRKTEASSPSYVLLEDTGMVGLLVEVSLVRGMASLQARGTVERLPWSEAF